MLETLSLSDILGYASIGCWLGAQFPQVIENIKLQSCEGLALPFLANWLLGDVSNLVGCILTHQLPFQTWLATYFVFVDFTLVAQYIYYYKPPRGLTILTHIRSSTSPAAVQRLSIDRGASRYRTLSAVASNVAAAAAIAAKQDEQQVESRASRTHYSRRIADRRQGFDNTGVVMSPGIEQGIEGEPPTALIESFRSERGRDTGPKRVSWSIERTRARASSVGQTIRATTPTAHNILSNEFLAQTGLSGALVHQHRDPQTSSVESLTPIANSRSSRASRKGSTMVFLGAWALFGFSTYASGRAGIPSRSATNVGRVLSSGNHHLQISASFSNTQVDARNIVDETITVRGVEFLELQSNDIVREKLHEEPTPEQVLGRIFAWLCTTLYLTSRLPQIWKNYARKSVEGLSMYLFIFAFLGNSFYASSILLSPRRYLPPPESTAYIRESIPYLLGSVGTLLFDITIVSQSFCYRHRHRRHSRLLDEEEAGLLSGEALAAHSAADSAILHRGRTSRSRSIA